MEDRKNLSMAGEFDGFSNVLNKKKIIEKFTNKLIDQYSQKVKKGSFFKQ